MVQGQQSGLSQAGESAVPAIVPSGLGSMRLFDLLADAPPDKTLLTWSEGTVTFGEMQLRSLSIASGLFASGLRRGDSIALFLNNTPECLAIAFASWRLGCGIVALNRRLGSKEVADLVARTNAKALFYAPGYRDGACGEVLSRCQPSMLASLRLIVSCDGTALVGSPLDARHISIDDLSESGEAPYPAEPGDPCLYLATSGTTSLPKIVVHAQARVYRHVHDAAAAIGFRPGAHMLVAIPLWGAYGVTTGLTRMAAQVPAGALVQPKNPAEYIQKLRFHQRVASVHELGIA